ncbi:MAG: GC-type dockerin domain-anchored protein [Planctomycetota bacterium]
MKIATTAALLLATATASQADNVRRITPDDPMTIRFRVDPGVTPTPDTLVVHLGTTIAGDPGTGTRFAFLRENGRSLGDAQSTDAFGDVVGEIELNPGVTFRTASSPYMLLDPGEVDLTDLIAGTEFGSIRIDITTGFLEVDLDDVRIEWGVATGVNAIDPAALQPEITEIFVGSPCYADFDRSGELDVFDFLAYLTAFQLGDYRADCDGCGSLDIFDYLCFLTSFDRGCP